MNSKKQFKSVIYILILTCIIVVVCILILRDQQKNAAVIKLRPTATDYLPTIPIQTETLPSGSTVTPSLDFVPQTVRIPPDYISQSFTFREQEYDDEIVFEYFYVDSGMKEIYNIGVHKGSLTWSPDGKYVAVNCAYDLSSLCLLDMERLLQALKEGQSIENIAQYYGKEVPLPEKCTEIMDPIYGLLSISWSPDGRNVAVVCGENNYQEKTQVCIIHLDGLRADCWNGDGQFKIVRRAIWSPMEDKLVLVVNGGDIWNPKIYLANPDGTDRVFLTIGWSPAWSPDGKEIAFARYIGGEYIPSVTSPDQGLARINIDPENPGLQWIYQNDDIRIRKLDMNCYPIECRVSWSADRKYIAFTNMYSEGPTNIYLIEISTKEISCLDRIVDSTTWSSEQDWRP